MPKRNPEVDAYLTRSDQWHAELKVLRAIVLECGLDEVLKWGKPCYTFEGHNVAILYRFKDFCALGFLKGALLADPEGVLVAPGKDSQAMRRLQFTDAKEIKRMKAVVKGYVQAAILVAKSGLEIDFKARRQLELPKELEGAFRKSPKLKQAFNALTPGRQRGYVLHFAGAKQSQTRVARIEKCTKKILAGKGFNER